MSYYIIMLTLQKKIQPLNKNILAPKEKKDTQQTARTHTVKDMDKEKNIMIIIINIIIYNL